LKEDSIEGRARQRCPERTGWIRDPGFQELIGLVVERPAFESEMTGSGAVQKPVEAGAELWGLMRRSFPPPASSVGQGAA